MEHEMTDEQKVELRGTRWCNRCQARHRNWDKCPKDTGPDDMRRPSPGFHEWRRNKMRTMRVHTENHLVQPRTHARRTGKLTEPPPPERIE